MRKLFVPGDAFHDLAERLHGVDRPTFEKLMQAKGLKVTTENGVVGYTLDTGEMKAEIALSRYASSPPRLACKHVVQGAVGASLCVQHPASGLLCVPCGHKHARRHDAEEELTCDGCRAVVPVIHPVYALYELNVDSIRDTAGYSRPFSGSVALCGVGFCAECMEGATTTTPAEALAVMVECGWRP